MFSKTDSLVTAERIVAGLFTERARDIMKHWFIESYQNGREQGLLIWGNNDLAYYICEHRNSDEICIYKGKYSMQSISDDAYKHPNYFNRNFDEASSWLIDELSK